MAAAEAQLIDTVKHIGPTLQQLGADGERARRLPKAALDALAEAGVQRMFTPKSLGGLEVDPLTCARVIEEVGRYDSAAAWALQSGNSGATTSSSSRCSSRPRARSGSRRNSRQGNTIAARCIAFRAPRKPR